MFNLEHRKSRLATKKQFRHRILKASIFSITIFIFSLAGGVCGYHFLAGYRWVDSFMNASMILGGMGPIGDLPNDGAKWFAGFYALYCGVAFLLSMAIFITPIVHRFLHKFNLDSGEVRGI
jgi:hypothetical protein